MASELPIRGAYLATINYLKAERAPLLHELDIDNYRFELRASPEKIFFLLYLPNGFVLLSLLSPAPIGAAEDVQVERRKEATTLRVPSSRQSIIIFMFWAMPEPFALYPTLH